MFRLLTSRPLVCTFPQQSVRTTPLRASRNISQSRRTMTPLPIIVCGKNPSIATAVRERMLPEYDVIHIILSVESGMRDIPLLLSSQFPANSSSNHGSRNYTKPPVAIALGGGFNDELFNQIKDSCKDVPSTIWLRVDTSKMAGPPKPEEMEKYGRATAERMKKKLGELRVSEEGGVKEGVFCF
ncbi:hypothetical protein T440DRAFT_443052 [Plenodomus tracheiphilus IPT5]|uniref:Uncharacterized protein n=1 Tax=Plenodomus tracheiphilus IPT5 TaxID=1408161 RepID=A0A6A7BFY1_9PLEO|nr:hypothetical protein T440DRAFT_443052 [Plenodomus tracheiphilus IPT5]